jgi:hypothetical protein
MRIESAALPSWGDLRVRESPRRSWILHRFGRSIRICFNFELLKDSQPAGQSAQIEHGLLSGVRFGRANSNYLKDRMSKSEKHQPSRELIMKAVLICDDFAFAARANASLRRVGNCAGAKVQWTIQCWPVNALNQAAMAEKILVESADTHLIVLPGRRAQSTPLWLQEWLERWAALRQIPDAAVAVIEDGDHTDSANTVSRELTLLVQKHGLNLITDNGATANDAAQIFVRLLREAEPPISLQRSYSANMVAGDSFRGLGINE